MSQIAQCQSCKGDFENWSKIPVLLPCYHDICAICAFDQFQKNMNIKCSFQQCQKVHEINPIKLQEDTQLLKILEQSVMQKCTTLLKSQKTKVKTAQTQLAKFQNEFFQQLMNDLSSIVLKDKINLQKELKQVNAIIQYQLNEIMLQQQIMQQGNQKQQYSQNKIVQQMDLKVQKMLDETQRVIQQNSQIPFKDYQKWIKINNTQNQVRQQNDQLQKQIIQQNQQILILAQENQNYVQKVKEIQEKVNN